MACGYELQGRQRTPVTQTVWHSLAIWQLIPKVHLCSKGMHSLAHPAQEQHEEKGKRV